MRSTKTLFAGFWLPLLILSLAYAGDYSWMQDFNMVAQADPSGFRARLDARFRIGDVNAVLSSVATPSDAFMLLRLGEMCGQPMDRVLETYETHKGKGWGVLAKSLGIKPGSSEFHALKQGQDLYGHQEMSKGKGKSKGKSKGKGQGKKNK